MSKYEPLQAFLRVQSEHEVEMSFSDIEALLGRKLPPIAHRERAWWSNNASNNVMTKAWLAAGYESARVDMAGERLVFRKAATPKAADREAWPATSIVDRIMAELGGTVTIAPGVDLTEPLWEAEGGEV